MSAALLRLERFDAPALLTSVDGHDIKTQQARAEAYAEGYAAGTSAASARTGERERLIAAIAALIEAEALVKPHKMQEQAVAAVRIIIETIFPALAQKGFAVEAAAALSSLAKESDGASLTINAPTEHAKALRGLLKEMSPGAAITVKADASLTGAVAKAQWSAGGVEFDLDRAAEQCVAALENALGKISNGKTS